MENYTTIDQLPAMINTGFNDVRKDAGQLKTNVNQLRQEMQAGFERIEHLLLAEQKREVEDVKKRMKKLEDALAV